MAQRNRSISRGGISLTHPNAAGIDIGSASHFCAVPPDRDDEPVREFKSFTADLERLADWLNACGVDMVAMESTGVYWIPLFELLEHQDHRRQGDERQDQAGRQPGGTGAAPGGTPLKAGDRERCAYIAFRGPVTSLGPFA